MCKIAHTPRLIIDIEQKNNVCYVTKDEIVVEVMAAKCMRG